MKAINIEWNLTDDVYEYNIDDYDIPTIVDLPKDLAENLLTDYFADEKGLKTKSYKLSSVADYLSNEYGFCVLSFEVVKDFEELSADELWTIRRQVVLNSLYEYDFSNREGYNSSDVSSFFDGYVNFIYELMDEDGADEKEFCKYDNIINLKRWFDCYDDLSWVKLDME